MSSCRFSLHFVVLLSGLATLNTLVAGAPFAQQEKPESTSDAPVVEAKPAPPDPRIGKKFIVTTAGAELRTPAAVVWKAYLGETFTASLTNGEWLWINDKGGWLWEKQTLPFDSAISTLTAAIDKEPTAEDFHLRGIARLAHSEFEKAISDFTESLKLRPDNAGVLNNRGKAHYLNESYDSALSDLNAAIKIDPKHFVAMNNRALVYIATNQLDQAMNDLNAALLLHTDYPEALNNRGVVSSHKQDFKTAIVDFTAALKIYENYTEAYGNRSFAYRRQGLYAEAIADLKLAIEKNPLDYQPVNDLAWVLATAEKEEFRDPAEALKYATQACQMTQYSNWNTLDTLAAAHAASGNRTEAVKWVTTAMQHAPDEAQKKLQEHRKLMREGQPVPP